jgi:hypothetical protein
MNIKQSIAVALVLGFAIYGTAFAAVENPFGDVAQDNWTYQSMRVLAEKKVIDGASFADGKTLTRYEMAALVAKAMWKVDHSAAALKDATQIDLEKLEREFLPELKNMGVPISASVAPQTEVTASTDPTKKIPDVTFSGGARLRYQINPTLTGTNKSKSDRSRFQERFTLNMSAPVADKVTFNMELFQENVIADRKLNTNSKGSTNNSPTFDKGEFVWKNANTVLTVGRFQPFLGQGLIYAGGPGNSMDGIYATYNFSPNFAASLGYADLNAGFNTGVTVNASIQNLNYKVNDNATFTAAHMKILNTPDLTGYLQKAGASYNFDQYALGTKIKTGEMTIIAEGVKNNASGLPAGAQDTGFWSRLQWKAANAQQPGTWQTSVDYLKMGNWAIDSDFWKIVLPIPGGNGINGDGAKGFGLDFDYVIAKNIDVDLKYYKLKPYDDNKSDFSSYDAYFGFITNWRF